MHLLHNEDSKIVTSICIAFPIQFPIVKLSFIFKGCSPHSIVVLKSLIERGSFQKKVSGLER